MRDDLIDRHRIEGFRRRRFILPLHHRGNPRGIGGREPSEPESLRVHLDGDGVDRDRLLDRFRRQRQQSPLIGIAHHHHVGGDGIAQQGFRRLGEIEESRILAQRGFQHVIDLPAPEIEIAVEDEVGGRNDVAVDDADRATRLTKRHGFLGSGHDFIGGDHEIGRAGNDARTGDVSGMFGQPDMTQHRPTLLRKPRHIQDHAGLALDMGGHAEQCADGQHAGAADAADGNVIGPLQRRF